MPRRGTDGQPSEVDATGMASTGDEAILLERVAARDGAAFRVLVERHLPALVSTARRILSDEAEAEDVAQEAFVRLWQGAEKLEIGNGSARPWLRRVVSNLSIDRIRARRRTEVTDEVPDQPVAATQFKDLATDELAARVDKVIQALPERQRQALVLFHYEGMSQNEISDVLQISEEAVESLLSRARRGLRTMLNDEWRQLLSDLE